MNRIKLNKFIKTGVLDCGLVFEKKECKRIYDEIYNSRNFRKIFVSEKYFSFFKKLNNLLIKFFPKSYPALIELKKKYRKRSMHPDVGVKGLNLTDNLNLDFIEKNKSFKKIMTSICGNNYNILLKKVVVGVPNEWIPEWVEKRIKGSQDTNLASYIKKKYRDMTYFRGIDFHQDIKDEAKKKDEEEELIVVPQNEQQELLNEYVVYFDFDKANIRPQDEAVLRQAASEITKYNPSDVAVVGYTDTSGSMAYNQALSARRANAVSNYLTSMGVCG